jgi:type III restriction enzyme
VKLKDYQRQALETVSNLDPATPGFLQLLAAQTKTHSVRLEAFRQRDPSDPLYDLLCDALENEDPFAAAWELAKARLGAQGDWHALDDGMDRSIPSVCLKLPTGGGKTLLAAHAVERLQVDWLKAQTGLVLWIVPSQAIYAQTLRALKDRQSALRQTLDRAAAGRVRILEKTDGFTRADTDSRLCVMVLMLQAARRDDEKVLKMFRGGGDASFFPEETDAPANDALLAAVTNLDRYDLGDGFQPGWPRRTLANVIRMLRPVVVLDEAHNAMTPLGHRTLSKLNPRFILELTATPTVESNVLVDVTGKALRDEEMIKLPINVAVDIRGQWQGTLRAALDCLNALEAAAREHEQATGDYIRPMMIVRVDHTGEKTRDQPIHVEDAFAWLVQHGDVPPEVIRRQTAEKKELADEDLMSPLTSTRVVITKDALREGWDAPFAYVLAILSSGGGSTALTQFIGRVLRQPYARQAGFANGDVSLDEAYVFCTEANVGTAVARINAGLTNEGMGDLASAVRTRSLDGGDATPAPRVPVTRAAAFRDRSILTPCVLRADEAVAGGWRPLDYEADLLEQVPWETLSWRQADLYQVAGDGTQRVLKRMDLGDDGVLVDAAGPTPIAAGPAPELNRFELVRRLCEVVPNPWQADRILGEALDALRARGADEGLLAAGRLTLIDKIASDLRDQIEAWAKVAFRAGVADGTITFRLTEPPLPQHLKDALAGDGGPLVRSDMTPLLKALYTPVLTHEVNGFEAPVALYLDEAGAVGWWWRVAARRDQVGLQGWRPHKVYPDFLVSLDADGRTGTLLMLETKGGHLAGNQDTTFKGELFEALEEAYSPAPAVGQVEAFAAAPDAVAFSMLFDAGDGGLGWRDDLARVLSRK